MLWECQGYQWCVHSELLMSIGRYINSREGTGSSGASFHSLSICFFSPFHTTLLALSDPVHTSCPLICISLLTNYHSSNSCPLLLQKEDKERREKGWQWYESGAPSLVHAIGHCEHAARKGRKDGIDDSGYECHGESRILQSRSSIMLTKSSTFLSFSVSLVLIFIEQSNWPG